MRKFNENMERLNDDRERDIEDQKKGDRGKERWMLDWNMWWNSVHKDWDKVKDRYREVMRRRETNSIIIRQG